MKLLSHVRLFATPWTVANQASLSMGFSRQEYWSGLLFPFPGDLPNPGIEPRSPTMRADALPSEPPGKPHSSESVQFSSVAQACLTFCDPHESQNARLLCPWDFPGKSTGVGCYFLFQGVFQIQGLNPGFLHCRQTFFTVCVTREVLTGQQNYSPDQNLY